MELVNLILNQLYGETTREFIAIFTVASIFTAKKRETILGGGGFCNLILWVTFTIKVEVHFHFHFRE